MSAAILNEQTLVVGGGLSGLRAAQLLVQRAQDVTVLESRSRLGGRILSQRPPPGTIDNPTYGFDMGPAWFWPWQEQMLGLLREMQLSDAVHEQFSEGDGMGEHADGRLIQQAGLVSMAGSLRLSGGLSTLIDAIAKDIPAERIQNDAHVESIHRVDEQIAVTAVVRGTRRTWQVDQVLLALPPRVIAQTIEFSPALPEPLLAQMNAAPTWMAGQAKLTALYEAPFWRNAGLSGDAMSQIGPLGEIHDASSPSGAPYALFGFVGLPAAARRGRADDIIEGAVTQLTRLFGHEASKPVSVHYKDWADDTRTATQQDSTGPRGHVHSPPATSPLWNHSLFFAGSETASISEGHNGYLEGALLSAHSAVNQMRKP